MSDISRCLWAEGDPVMTAYHDTEWGRPVRDSRALWEMLMLEGFQAGLSWRTILHRREGFRAAFRGFEPETVARFDAADIERLMADAGIIRSRAKIEATIGGARVYLAMQAAGDDFAEFAWAMAGGKPIQGDGVHVPASTPLSQEISAALKKRGYKFVGPVIVYAWMQAVGMVNDHSVNCFCRANVAKAPRKRPTRKPPAERVTYDTVRRLALALPNVEEGTSYGTPALKVKGSLMVRLREDLDSLVIKMPLDQREELMAADPETYYITDHYRDYPWMLVRLSNVRMDAIADLLQIAYRAAAPSKRGPAPRSRPVLRSRP